MSEFELNWIKFKVNSSSIWIHNIKFEFIQIDVLYHQKVINGIVVEMNNIIDRMNSIIERQTSWIVKLKLQFGFVQVRLL